MKYEGQNGWSKRIMKGGVWKRNVSGFKKPLIPLDRIVRGMEWEFYLLFGLGILNPSLNFRTCLRKGLGFS